MLVVLLGPPGAGKGTQSQYLVQKGFEHLSTGDLLRKAIAEQTDLGKQVDHILKKGHLVPDDIMLDCMKAHLDENHKKNILLDGFPRTLPQAKGLDAIAPPDRVLAFHAPWEDLKKRLLERFKKEGRNDDALDIMEERFRIYEDTIEDLLAFYQERNLLTTINAIGDRETIRQNIRKCL